MNLSNPVKLIAIVGAGGNIGPENAPLQFADEHTQRVMSEWVMSEITGSCVVIGSNTLGIMARLGFNGEVPGVTFFQWSRGLGMNPDEFIEELKRQGRPIVILGGAKTYEVFGPYVDTFILRRVKLTSAPDHKLPNFFEGRNLQ